uniref:Uncharacterized protein n=1 Tax=Arundo donax TaxID=35708 RepID=A0A0A9AA21_ARUDO
MTGSLQPRRRPANSPRVAPAAAPRSRVAPAPASSRASLQPNAAAQPCARAARAQRTARLQQRRRLAMRPLPPVLAALLPSHVPAAAREGRELEEASRERDARMKKTGE